MESELFLSILRNQREITVKSQNVQNLFSQLNSIHFSERTTPGFYNLPNIERNNSDSIISYLKDYLILYN